MDAAVWTLQSYNLASWAWLPLIVGVVAAGFGVAGLTLGRSTSESLSSNLFMVTAGLWIGSTGMVIASTDAGAATWWSRVMVLGGVTMTPLVLRSMETVIPESRTPRSAIAVIWLLWFALVIAGLQTDTVVAGRHHHWFGSFPRWGPLAILFFAYSLSGSLIVIRSYLTEVRRAPADSQRRQRSWLLLLAASFGLLTYVDFLPGWGVPLPPIGFAAIGILLVLSVRAAVRYNALDLSMMASTHQVVSRMEDPLLVVSRDGEIGYANPAAVRTFDAVPGEIVGRRVDDVTEGRVRTEQVLAVLDRGEEGPQDIVLDENTGFPRYLAVSAAPMDDRTGRPFAAVLVFRDHTIRERYRADLEIHRVKLEETVVRRTRELGQTVERLQREITERERAERTREQSEARFHELADLLPEAVYEIDLNAQVTYVNRHGLEATGYSPEDVERGFYGPDIFVPEDRAAAMENMRKHMQGSGDAVREYTVLRKDGSTFPALLRSMPLIHDGQPVGLRGLLLDISQRKELELQLRQSQRIEAIGKLAGGVAHDFNNLLTVILGTSFFIRKELPAEGRGRADLATLDRAAQRASELTRQLLAFSRKQVLERRHVQLNDVIEELRVMLARLIGEDIEVELGLDPALGLLEVDRAQIEQVLMNLAVNARDAMPRGGSLRITTEQVQLDEETTLGLFEPRTLANGPSALLTVRDDGAGMSTDVRHHAFEPFFTTKGREAGTGLGLSTVYGIVRQHDGAITVESSPGHGAAFRIYLPIDESGTVDRPAISEDGQEFQGAERILVVEDDDVVRDVVVRHLTQFGYQVRQAADAEQVLAEGLDGLADIDLLLTDVVMPGMDSHTLAERVQLAHPGMRVLFMSGYTDDRLQTHRVDTAGTRLLTKPFTQQQLVREVRDVLAVGVADEAPAGRLAASRTSPAR